MANRQTAILDAEIHAAFGMVTGADKITSTVAKAVKEGAAKFGIDPKAMQPFQKQVLGIATQMNNLVGKTRSVGLVKDAERLEGIMERMRGDMVQDATKALEIRAKIAEAETDEVKAQLREQLQGLQENMTQRRKMLDAEVKGLSSIIEQQEDVLKEYANWAKKSKAEQFVAGAGVAEGFVEKLGKVDPKDLGGLAKGFLGGVGKAAKGAQGMFQAQAAAAGTAEAAASASSMAAAAGSVAAIAASLAAVVGVIVAIGALFVEADSRAKEMNKTLLETAGIADMSSQSVEGLTTTLDAARESAIQLSYEFRRPAKEIIEIIGYGNEAGLTFKEMEERLSATGDKMEAYGNFTRTALVYSKTLSTSTKDIATVSADWMHDFGMGLEDVQKSFSAISQVASVSGIGTKRFFGFVTQATQGMALYNVRVEEAAALVGELSESLGDTNAADFVKALMKGFTADAYTERFKKVLLAGQGPTTRILQANAEVLAGEFGKAVQGSGKMQDVREAFAKVMPKGTDVKGFMEQLASGDAAALQKLQGMTAHDQRALLREVTAADKASGRQLSKLIDGTDFMSGSLTDQAKSLDELGPGGKLAMQLSAASSVIGAPISEMTGIQLAAFEQMTGISGEQLFELRKVDAQLRGNYEFAQEQLAKQDITHADNLELIKQTGMMVAKTADGNVLVQAALDEQGNIIAEGLDKNGNVIEGANLDTIESQEEMMVKFGDALTEATEKPLTAQEKLAQEVVANTESIFNVLDSYLSSGFETLTDILQAFYNAWMGISPETVALQKELLADTVTKQGDIISGIRDQKAALEEGQAKLAEAKDLGDTEAQAAAEAQIKAAEAQIKAGEVALAAEEARETEIREGKASELTREKYVSWTRDEEGNLPTTFGGVMGAVARNPMGAISTGFGEILHAPTTIADIKATKAQEAVERERAAGVAAAQGGAMEALPAGYGVLMEPYAAAPGAGGPSDFVAVQEDATEATIAATDAAASEQVDATEQQTKDLTKAGPIGVAKGLEMAERTRMATTAAELLGGGEEAQKAVFDKIMKGGRLSAAETGTLQGISGIDPQLLAAIADPTTLKGAQDFIWRAGEGISTFSSSDDIMGAKPGGPFDKAGGNPTIPPPVININGGDTALIYKTVSAAILAARQGGPTGSR